MTSTQEPRAPDQMAPSAAVYLDALSLKIFRYVSAFHFLIQESEKLPEGDTQLSLEEVEQFAIDQRDLGVRESEPADVDLSEDNYGIIDPEAPEFLAAIKVVQDDIKRLIVARYAGDGDLEAHSQLRGLVDSDIEALKLEYGSVSHTWDCLIGCKQRLAVPAYHEFAVGSWHVACVSETERLIGETVLLTLATFGRNFLQDVTGSCFGVLNLQPTLQDLMKTDTTDEAVSNILQKAMRRGSAETVLAARVFSDGIGVSLMEDNPGIMPGLLDLLSWARSNDTIEGESTCLSTFRELLDWRREVIHASVLGDEVSSPRRKLPLFRPHRSEDLSHLAQFLAAIGLRFALDVAARIIGFVKEHAGDEDLTEVEVREWKLAADLRVLHLDMLKEQEWGLAWAISEPIQNIGDPSRQDMPRLNAFYARTKLDDRFVLSARNELSGFVPSRPAREYELIRRSILEEWDDIDVLLDEVLAARILSLGEMETWPALEPLRHCRVYNDWKARHLE